MPRLTRGFPPRLEQQPRHPEQKKLFLKVGFLCVLEHHGNFTANKSAFYPTDTESTGTQPVQGGTGSARSQHPPGPPLTPAKREAWEAGTPSSHPTFQGKAPPPRRNSRALPLPGGLSRCNHTPPSTNPAGDSRAAISPRFFLYAAEREHKQNWEQQMEFSSLLLFPLNKGCALLPLDSREKFL